MGTPDFAVESLKKIHEKYNVVGVITAPDRKAGRGQKLRMSAVKEFAISENLHVLQPTNLKSEEFVDELRSLGANIFVVVAFRMLPRVVWDMPELGTINLHGSLLPDYRGAAPINWAVMNGDSYTGVSSFYIEEKIDTGNVILQHQLPIGENETAGELHDRMMVLGADTLIETLKMIEKGDVKAIQQNDMAQDQMRPAHKIFKEDCKINWSNSSESVHNFIRGLSPYPTAWTEFNSKTYKIFSGIKTKFPSTDAGRIESDGKNWLRIHCNDFQYEILEIQMQGKKRMNIVDFLRGNGSEFIS